ncbi:hypothetical protein [Ammonifex thiophilus]|uniref:DUF11 domain-containing protein n=1 Tax=Ammonifex thiophilus TaxID=444093 RepID=A0A3D8P2P2_9THEO|nr:hypothetical protein [Ammonifex thiophilus]RDV82530.1 hypothetical protein DXX99_07195 [Ammonifex thiophilus]
MKRAKFLSLVMVIALALMGAAYAAWTETININASVATGTYDVTFSSVSTNDVGDTVDPGADKNVGKTEATISEDAKTITVTAENTYPGYNAEVTYKIKNTGTIPLKVQSIEINIPESDKGKIEVTNEQDIAGKVLDPGQEAEGKIKHVVTDNAVERASYSYTLKVNTIQWNK